MIVLLFGISGVGKTAIGEKLAQKLDYDFADLDAEIIRQYQSIDKFQQVYPFQDERYKEKGRMLKELMLNAAGDTVIAVSPIFYAGSFNRLLDWENVLAIELQNTPEHIFEHLVFSDEDDNVYEDEDCKQTHKKEYIREIKKDITYVKKTFKKIEHKYFIDSQSADEAADSLCALVKKLAK